MTASGPKCSAKRLLSLRKSFNGNNLIFQTVEDGFEFIPPRTAAALNPDLDTDPVAEAAFALLYFQRATDLIPDSIPGMGLLDDAIIVGLVLRRHDHAFRGSSHAYKLPWPAPSFGVDQLLSVISPLRLTSFYSSLATRPSD